MRRLSQCLIILIAFMVATTLFGDTVVPGGTISGTWTDAGSPYLIQGDITIHADSSLMIEPGVEINFQGQYQLFVNGTLLALGTAQDSIIFTAADTATGWKGIRINEGIDSTRMEYCIVEHGHRTGSALSDFGGGIYSASIEAAISHCRISDCRAFNGGGMSVNNGSGLFTISACTFSDNDTEHNGGGLYYSGPGLVMSECLFESDYADDRGGGLYCWGYMVSSMELTSCKFIYNGTSNGGGGGAWIEHIQNDSGVSITDCEFTCNSAWYDYGGGLSLYSANPVVITNCTFSNNYCYYEGSYFEGGGGLYQSGGDLTLSISTFDHNWAASGGGALSYIHNGPGVAVIESCTFARNLDWGWNGPGALKLDGDVTIVNTIVSGSYSIGGIYSAGINFVSGSHSVEYCDFYDNGEDRDFIGSAIPAGLGEITGVNANGDSCDAFHNIFLDPLICDTANGSLYEADGDYHIADMSPCLGAGEGGTNIGALGVGCAVLCGDANSDDAVNVSDAVWLLNYIFEGGDPPSPMVSGEVNCDGDVNVSDVVWLLNYIFIPGSPAPCECK